MLKTQARKKIVTVAQELSKEVKKKEVFLAADLREGRHVKANKQVIKCS
jgi:hypothetical protein